jgi:hypothetical protein
MRVEESCKVLCRMHYTEDQAQQFREKIKEGYYTNWFDSHLRIGPLTYRACALVTPINLPVLVNP